MILYIFSTVHASGILRKRKTSEKSAEEGSTEKEDVREEKKRRQSINATLRGNKYFTFNVEKICSTETVHKYDLELLIVAKISCL